MNMEIKIRYTSDRIERLAPIEGKGDWIDLRSAEEVELKQGEFHLLDLGVAMELPEGYEAHVVPRSSSFKRFGVIQTNHMGVIDHSYCGDGDIWKWPILAMRDTKICVNDRVCQFRIVKNQPPLEFVETEHLADANRGGFGSTGIK